MSCYYYCYHKHMLFFPTQSLCFKQKGGERLDGVMTIEELVENELKSKQRFDR